MFEKVNPSHPDKIADRIAGAIVDLAYSKSSNPKVAVEVLIGHGNCFIINETSLHFLNNEIEAIVFRILGKKINVEYKEVKQNSNLANNQSKGLRCGDNGIFKGFPISNEEARLTNIAKELYKKYKSDGKYLINGKKVIICQSKMNEKYPFAVTNPLGYWDGGLDVDSGATNRKLGSDMGQSITGGGLHGKDLSKPDISLSIYTFLKAQKTGKIVELHCAIGDKIIDKNNYSEIVKIAKKYINSIGGFEKFAEWGLIR